METEVEKPIVEINQIIKIQLKFLSCFWSIFKIKKTKSLYNHHITLYEPRYIKIFRFLDFNFKNSLS